MTAPRAVVFDLGKVLLDFDYRVAIERLTASSASDGDRARELLMETGLLLDYETGCDHKCISVRYALTTSLAVRHRL